MLKQDLLISALRTAIYCQLSEFFIAEDFTNKQADLHSYEISMKYSEEIAKKVAEICGEGK
jgi:hypothetical protein